MNFLVSLFLARDIHTLTKSFVILCILGVLDGDVGAVCRQSTSGHDLHPLQLLGGDTLPQTAKKTNR